MPNRGDLKVWWIPQLPGKAFEALVGNTDNYESLRAAKLLLATLAHYDLFLLEHRHRCDFANTGGLLVYHPDEGWIDWCDGDCRSIDEVEESEIANGGKVEWEYA